MRNGKTTIRFFIRNTKGTGRSPIYLRLIYLRQKLDISIGEDVIPADWNATLGRAKKNDELNYHLDKLYDYLIEQKREMLRADEAVSVNALKQKLLEKSDPLNLLGYFNNHLQRIQEMSQDYGIGTIKQYVTSYRYLEKFLQKKFKTGISISQVDYTFLYEFDEYLKTRKPRLMPSTIRSRHSKFRAVLYDAYKKGVISHNPYLQFKLKTQLSCRTFLSQSEIDALITLDLTSNPCLERVRDIFMFSIYSGLRFSDAQDLRKENLICDNGQHYITKVINKTGRQFMLPLLDHALNILEKYRYMEHIDQRLLPVISNQKLNKYIKLGSDKSLQFLKHSITLKPGVIISLNKRERHQPPP